MASMDLSKIILFSACICCHNGVWTEFEKLTGDFNCSCLCIEEQLCIQTTKLNEPLLCGMPEGKFCQVGLGCCAIALKAPELPKVLNAKGHCLCCASSAAFPFDEENPLMCGLCFVSLFPNFGIAISWADATKAGGGDGAAPAGGEATSQA